MATLIHQDGTVTDLGFLKNNEFAVVGRAPTADIRIVAKGVASAHCRIMNVRGRMYLQTISRRHEVFVNGVRTFDKEQILENGQAIRLGDWSFTFQSGAAAVAEEAFKAAAETAPKERLKQEIHKVLLDRMDLKGLDQKSNASETAELRERASEMIQEIMKEFAVEIQALNYPRDQLYREILDDVLGFGPLDDFLRDAQVTEIMVGGGNKIYVERAGKLALTDRHFASSSQIVTIIERIVGPLGRRIDESSPIVDARLPNGSRVNAVIPPIAIDGPSLNIRKFPEKPLGVDDLIGFGSLSPQMAAFLKIAVAQRRNIIISGGTGSGKTTLLNVVSSFISPRERIVTIEDSAELRLEQDHVIRLETRPPNIEGKGEISIRTLVRNALRMRPDRIIVGECRGGETLDMLQAMNTGHDGSLTTIHANTPHDVIGRLVTMVLMSGMELPVDAIRAQIASAVHLICQQTRLSDGARKIVSIAELNLPEENEIELQEIFTFRQTGLDAQGRIQGQFMPTGTIPMFVADLRQRGIDVDMSMFVINE